MNPLAERLVNGMEKVRTEQALLARADGNDDAGRRHGGPSLWSWL
jgi:hypothetical protein